jgi:uncharacterized protein YqeY
MFLQIFKIMIEEKIQEDVKQAMRQKDTTKLNVLRGLKNAITNAKLAKGSVESEINDIEIISLIRKQVQQREDSAAQFKNGERQELAEKELAEKAILTVYLPAELSQDELFNIVDQAINDVMAVTKKDMGKAIKRALELADGRASNKEISQLISQKLN